MDVLAVLCVRNEARRIANCLGHLADNGVHFAVIDHGSTDETAALVRQPRFSPWLADFSSMPWTGEFHLGRQMDEKQRLIDQLDAEWSIHLDADEIPHSRRDGESLADAVRRLAGDGCNTIDFDEFVFLPVDRDYQADAGSWQPMLHYYLFGTRTPRLLRAVKRGQGLSFAGTLGHAPQGGERRCPDERLVLRHYLFDDQEHAFRKYVGRAFSAAELDQGVHRNRAGVDRDAYLFPPRDRLKRLSQPSSRDFDCGDRKPRHYWQWRWDGGASRAAMDPST